MEGHPVRCAAPAASLRRAAVALLALALAVGLVVAPPPARAEGSGGFVDTGGVHGPAIEALVAAGATDGCTSERFCPDRALTRAEMAKLLVVALDLPVDGVEDAFGDDDGRLLEPWIDALAASGITAGCDRAATSFCPDGEVTRAQLAAFVVRGLGLTGTRESYSDDEGSPFEPAIEAATVARVAVGCARWRFCPGRSASRGEAAAQLARALELVELPGRSPVRPRLAGVRLVAPYGRPGTAVLGVLGEQGVRATMRLAAEYAAQYDGLDPLPALPAVELITTLATAAPGPDGDYSQPLDRAVLRTWVDAAADAGVEVVLDLQPGRTDFPTQARQLEEFLAEPHVGLALDPEWRLGPDELHLRQVGSVSAAEVNATGDWFARLAEREGLPQQLFLVHQFRLDMVTERGTLRRWPQLREVIQMDGQGSQAEKDATWERLTDEPPAGWAFGWKQFHDEDTTLRSPADTVALRPRPVLVTFQ